MLWRVLIGTSLSVSVSLPPPSRFLSLSLSLPLCMSLSAGVRERVLGSSGGDGAELSVAPMNSTESCCGVRDLQTMLFQFVLKRVY